MNLFTRLSQKFMTYLADYTALKDVADQMVRAETLIQTNKNDREFYQKMQGSTSAQTSLLTQLYEQFINYRNDLNKYESLKSHYLVIEMIDTLTYDVLAMDPNTEKSFDIEIDDKFPKSKIANKIINDFRYRISLDTFVSKIMYDAIFYGQYWIEYLRDKHGHIIGLKDSYQPGSIFTVNLEGLDSQNLYYKISNKDVNKIVELPPKNIAMLNLQSDRCRFSIVSQQLTLQSKDATIAQAGVIGRPFCYDIYDKLVALETIDQLYLSTIHTAVQRNSIVSVTAPEGLDLAQLKEFTLWYQDAINDNELPELSELYDLNNIKLYASEATKLRVIPQQPQRGSISESLSASALATGESLPASSDRLMNKILDIKGIPPEYVTSGQQPGNIGDHLRKYIRYSRTVKYMQNGLRKFLTKLTRDILDSYNIKVTDDYIIVKQYCSVNVAELDRLEYMQSTCTVIDSVKATIDSISNDPVIKDFVNKVALARFYEGLLDSIPGASQIIQVPDNAKNEDIKDDKIKD